MIRFYNLSEMHFTKNNKSYFIVIHFYNLSEMHFTIKLCYNSRLHDIFQKIT
jgi:hypothetical protein